jgi:hypothetical protein
LDDIKVVGVWMSTRNWEDGEADDQITVGANDAESLIQILWGLRMVLPECHISDCKKYDPVPVISSVFVTGLDWKSRLSAIRWIRAHLCDKGWLPADLDPEYYGTAYVFLEAVVT